jgi:DnaJ-class molecular chaperone
MSRPHAQDVLSDAEKRSAYDIRRQRQHEALEKLKKTPAANANATRASTNANANSNSKSTPASGASTPRQQGPAAGGYSGKENNAYASAGE